MKKSAASTPNPETSADLSAANAGQFLIGGDVRVKRLGFGAMRITGKGIWGEPKDVGPPSVDELHITGSSMDPAQWHAAVSRPPHLNCGAQD